VFFFHRALFLFNNPPVENKTSGTVAERPELQRPEHYRLRLIFRGGVTVIVASVFQ
jgi:hypothetical protein